MTDGPFKGQRKRIALQQTARACTDAARVARMVEAQRVELETAILRTPSGETRNKLTEANIHLMAAIKSLAEATCESYPSQY